MKNNFSQALISGSGTQVQAGKVTLEVRLPWYRTLPLSVIEFSEVTVDGRKVSLDNAWLELDGKRHSLTALPELIDTRWFVLDSGFLHVEVPEIEGSLPHDLSLLLKLYPPYIPMLTWATSGHAAVSATA